MVGGRAPTTPDLAHRDPPVLPGAEIVPSAFGPMYVAPAHGEAPNGGCGQPGGERDLVTGDT